MDSGPGSIVLLFGPPAAGKSSLARDVLCRYRAFGEARPLLYMGTDQLREALSGRAYLASARPVIYKGMKTMAQAAALAGHHVLVDGNYLDERKRRPLLTMASRHRLPLLRVLVHCSLSQSLRRNAGRVAAERVPEDYLRQVYSRIAGARADADLVLDTDTGDPGAAHSILEWLLGRSVAGLPLQDLTQEWSREGERRLLAPGDVVWRTGEESRQVILLLEGQLEVVRESPDQPPVVINQLGPGELAGELSSLDGGAHSATVRALSPCQLVSLEPDQFRGLLRRHPALLDQVLQGMATRIRSLSQVASAASLDLLTGLANRRVLERQLPQLGERALRDGRPLSLALFDVDRFKGINDTYGHQAGDLVLREVGRLLRESLPPSTVSIRYGGDEFIVLFPECSGPQALAEMQTLAQRIKATPFLHQEAALRVSVSVGVACCPDQASGWEDLHRLADEAAYASKKAGRDRVTLFGS